MMTTNVNTQRRFFLPCIILLCFLIYAIVFISFFNSDHAISVSTDSSELRSIATSVRKSCNILIAHGGDDGAGFATLIFVYPINFLLYAQKYNYTLWLDFIPKFNNLYFDPAHGPNPFEYYFHGITPDWHNECDNATSHYTKLRKGEINPKIHKQEKSSIHCWYYHAKAKQIHKNMDAFDENWYFEQRLRGSQIVDKYFHLKDEITRQRNVLWNDAFGNREYKVLGVQMRGSDKVQSWSIRRTVLPQEYMPYIAAFVQYFDDKAKVFFATDDTNYYAYLQQHWSAYLNDTRYTFKDIVVTQQNVTRSANETAVFELQRVSKYEIGREVLLDILLLAKCDWFIHSASAVSEAVFYNNLALHNRSVHLEYLKKRQVPFWFTK